MRHNRRSLLAMLAAAPVASATPIIAHAEAMPKSVEAAYYLDALTDGTTRLTLRADQMHLLAMPEGFDFSGGVIAAGQMNIANFAKG